MTIKKLLRQAILRGRMLSNSVFSEMQGVVLSSCVLLAGIFLLTHFQETESNPINSRGEFRDGGDDDIQFKVSKQYLLDLINNLEQDLLTGRDHLESQKRGLDFGLGRGYSGAEMAKHKLGLAAASNPWGPGRRKRSFQYSTLSL